MSYEISRNAEIDETRRRGKRRKTPQRKTLFQGLSFRQVFGIAQRFARRRCDGGNRGRNNVVLYFAYFFLGRIVERNFTAGEAAEVKDLESFLKVWTKKEAYLKLTGDGLSGLRSSDVSKPLFYDGKPVESTTLAIFDGYVGTVVAESQPIIFVQLD